MPAQANDQHVDINQVLMKRQVVDSGRADSAAIKHGDIVAALGLGILPSILLELYRAGPEERV